MLAALLTRYDSPLDLATVADPVAGPDDAIIAVRACGVCRSDWHVWCGDWQWRMQPALPHIMGHEVAGEIVAVGRGMRRRRVGDRVTLPFHLSCADCSHCRSGRSNLCERYTAIGFQVAGGFAELMRVPDADRNLVPVPGQLGFAEAATLGCRYGSAFHGLTGQLRVRPGEWLALFGCGGLGLSAVQIGAALGARIVAVDPRPEHLAQAMQAGADAGIRMAETAEATAEAVREATGGGAHVSVDAVGAESALAAAVLSLRARGRHLQLGLTGARERGVLPIPIDRVVKQELRLFGSVGCPRSSFRRVVGLAAAGRLQPGTLVRRRLGLEAVSSVLEAMSSYQTVGFDVITP